MKEIWILRGGVVAPDGHFLHGSNWLIQLLGDLGHRTVVIETSHRGEATRVESLGVLLGDERVGVGWVANDAGFDVLVGVLVHGLADSGEDGTVVLDKVSLGLTMQRVH